MCGKTETMQHTEDISEKTIDESKQGTALMLSEEAKKGGKKIISRKLWGAP